MTNNIYPIRFHYPVEAVLIGVFARKLILAWLKAAYLSTFLKTLDVQNSVQMGRALILSSWFVL